MPRVSANGIAINYEIEGREGAPVVTMSHSLSANLRMWDPQMQALVGRYRVLRYDTRGHGASEVPAGPYSLEMLADDAVGLLNSLGIKQTHFVGLSMGGMIGQTLGLRYPDRILSLTLADTASSYDPEAAKVWQQRIESARKNGLAPNVEPTIERWFSPGFIENQPATIDKVREMIRATPVEGYVGCSQAISQLDLTGRLGDIRAPTLVVVGEDDPGTPVAASRIIYDNIAGSELVILPVARHLSNIEDPVGFNAALINFLTRLA